MKSIAVIGNRIDTEISDVLQKLFFQNDRSFLSACVFSFFSSNPLPPGPEFLILDAASPHILREVPLDIMIFKKSAPSSSFNYSLDTPRPATAIFDPQTRGAARWLQGSPTTVVTCGLSPKDTVTYSSISEEKSCVTLLRELKRTDGSLLEPQDIPTHLTIRPNREYEALAAIAAALICGMEKI